MKILDNNFPNDTRNNYLSYGLFKIATIFYLRSACKANTVFEI